MRYIYKGRVRCVEAGVGFKAVFAAAHSQRERASKQQRRPSSSQRWLERQLNDPYVAAAKREGWKSRAAFKLIEVDDKHHILAPGKRVLPGRKQVFRRTDGGVFAGDTIGRVRMNATF